jgi:hypothetical protein
VKLAVVDPADRDDEFVAYPASECAGLCEGEVMRVGGHAAAHETGLPEHESSVVFIAQANWFAQSLDHILAELVFGSPRVFAGRARIWRARPFSI